MAYLPQVPTININTKRVTSFYNNIESVEWLGPDDPVAIVKSIVHSEKPFERYSSSRIILMITTKSCKDVRFLIEKGAVVTNGDGDEFIVTTAFGS